MHKSSPVAELLPLHMMGTYSKKLRPSRTSRVATPTELTLLGILLASTSLPFGGGRRGTVHVGGYLCQERASAARGLRSILSKKRRSRKFRRFNLYRRPVGENDARTDSLLARTLSFCMDLKVVLTEELAGERIPAATPPSPRITRPSFLEHNSSPAHEVRRSPT